MATIAYEALYKARINARKRYLVFVGEFPASVSGDLFHNLSRVPWDKLLDFLNNHPDKTINIYHSTYGGGALTDSQLLFCGYMALDDHK